MILAVKGCQARFWGASRPDVDVPDPYLRDHDSMECLDPNTLNAFAEGLLSSQQATEAERHLDACASCRLALSALAGRSPLESVPAGPALVAGRFLIDREVGRGGMGVVFRALDQVSGECVAIKRMLGTSHDAARFRREAEILARIDHPNVVRYVAHGQSEAGTWLAMEWIDGRDLASVIASGAPARTVALQLVVQVADAVAAAHGAGVIHRDLKPSNIMLLREDPPRAKVVDFGLAKDLEAGAVLTTSGTLLGTPLYMAPEQLRGEPASVASDVYALATVVFELIAGHTPFSGAAQFAIIGRILLETAPRLAEVCEGVPGPLSDLIARGLSKDPAERPHSGVLAGTLAELAWQWMQAPTVCVSSATAPPDFSAEQRSSAVMVVRLSSDLLPTANLLRQAGAAVELLPKRTLIALLADPRAPDAPFLRAVRLGLDICASDDRAAIVVTGARSRARPSSVERKLVERADTLLNLEPGVHLEPDVVGLLGSRFEVIEREPYATVIAERTSDEERLLFGRHVPFMGRGAEMSQLLALVSAVVSEGSARAAIVVAPPGHGKSRLRVELTRQVREKHSPAAMMLARFEPGNERVAYAGLSRGVRAMAGIVAGESAARQRELLVELCRPASMTDAQVSFLAALAGVAGEQDDAVLGVARSSADMMREGTKDAFRTLLRGAAGEGLLLLLLEDGHWADEASFALVDDILSQPDMPVAVIAFCRPELTDAQPNLWQRRAPLRLDLGPLSARVTRRLVHSVLSVDTDEAVVARIIELAAGSPLVIEELLRAFVGSGVVTPSMSAKAVFEARIARLSGSQRLVARTAAVIGEVFWDSLVVGVLGAAVVDVRAVLAELVADELIAARPVSRFSGTVEYAFRHSLLQDAARSTAPDDVTQRIHAVTARWLIDNAEPEPGVVAEHAELGGLAALAGEQWARAGVIAANAGAASQAIEMLERALQRLPRNHPERANVCLALEDLCRDSAKVRRRVRHLAAFRRMARAGSPEQRAVARLRHARLKYDNGDVEGARLLSEDAIRCATQAGAMGLEPECQGMLAIALRDLGMFELAQSHVATALERRDSLTPAVLGSLLWKKGVLARWLGRMHVALEAYGEAQSIYERAGVRSVALAEVLNASAYAFVVDCQLAEASRCLDRARGILESCGASRILCRVEGNAASVAMIGGDLRRAARHAEVALELHRQNEEPEAQTDSCLVRAQIALLEGDTHAAWKLVHRAERLNQAYPSPYDLAHALLTRAWILHREGDPKAADGVLERARSVLGTSRSMACTIHAESARTLSRLCRFDDAAVMAKVALGRLAEIDGCEWAVQTFDAVLESVAGRHEALFDEAALRALSYLEQVRGKIGDEWKESFFGREDVRRVVAIASERQH